MLSVYLQIAVCGKLCCLCEEIEDCTQDCHKLMCKLYRTLPPSIVGPIYRFGASRPCGPSGWLALLLTKAGDVDTNPGPTTSNKRIWSCIYVIGL